MIASLCLGAALLPLAMLLLNLPFYRRPRAGDAVPISVLIPARDEERNIGDAVRCVLASTGINLELIVLDDHSTDRTREILASIDDPRLRVLDGLPLPAGWCSSMRTCGFRPMRCRVLPDTWGASPNWRLPADFRVRSRWVGRSVCCCR